MDALLRRLGDEVRESLHQILGAMELMSEEPLSENQRHYLARCRASADQLLCTANDLAELARTEFPPLRSRAVPRGRSGGRNGLAAAPPGRPSRHRV